MAIRTILYDLGNVLVCFSHERMYEQIGAVCGRSTQQVRELFERRMLPDFETGRIDERGFHARMEEWSGRRLDADELRRAGSDIFWPNPGMADVVRAMKRQGVRLVLLSNTSAPHIEHVRASWPLLELFDNLILSFEVGATKPQPEIYQAALDRIGCPPSECFYTDDIPEYVEAGRSHGLTAEVFTGKEEHLRQLKRYGVDILDY